MTTTEVTDVKAALTEGLTELRLPTVRLCYEETARLAERETLSYERYLLQLVTRECEDRQRNRIQRLLSQSRIPAEKALSTFSLKRLPPKVALVTKTLLEGEFLDRCENVLAFGNPGSGKTHLLCAIGQELIARGRRIYFTTAALLVQDLLVAKRDLKLSRFIKRLAAFEGLIIDDLGYVQQSREEMEVLFTLLAERYERGSVLISSNLPFSKWEGIFKDAMTTAAAIDRLVHHCVILELNIPSYRVEQAKKAKADSTVEWKEIEFKMGLCPGAAPNPGIYRFPASMPRRRGGVLAARLCSHLVGARVPSLESPILLSGMTSIAS